MNKKYKPIPNYENFYEINKSGNIRSFPRNGTSKFKKLIKPDILPTGYKQIKLCKNGNQKVFKVHRLVAFTFIDNPENKPFINHIDGNPSNNDISNLEWCTAKENINHAIKTGLHNPKGENNGNAKLTEKKVLQIREKYNKWNEFYKNYIKEYSQSALAKKYNVTVSSISHLIKTKNNIKNFRDKSKNKIYKINKSNKFKIIKKYEKGILLLNKYKKYNQKSLAKKYNITQVQISTIIKRNQWINVN